MTRALPAFLATLAAWLFCVLASSFRWHAGITGPAAAASTLALIACAVWLNRSAS